MLKAVAGKKIHFVGIAGVGMSSVAVAAKGCGADVSGSDRYADSGTSVAVLEVIKRMGIPVVPQDGSGIEKGTTLVVVSTAIEDDNPDLARARTLGVRIIHRSEMLAELVSGSSCIAVAGTSGKTTATGMLGYLLEGLGADPSVVNGGVVVNWKDDCHTGNARIGSGDLWVIEADESDRSLLNYRPDRAIITNMSADHFDLAETEALFDAFSLQVNHVIVHGTMAGIDVQELGANHAVFRCDDNPYTLNLAGVHNIENAGCAIRMCRQLGFTAKDIASVLKGFKGIERRLECKGIARGVAIYDDYGHNPAKIEAAWSTLAPYYERLHVLWRPHGYGPLASMSDELVQMLSNVCRATDQFSVLPVYYVGGTVAPSLNSEGFVNELNGAGVAAEYVSGYEDYARLFDARVRGGDALVCMGARDPELPLFADRTVARLRDI